MAIADLTANGDSVPELMYRVHRDQIYNPLLACSVQLSDHPAGKGGFVVVPGSHKGKLLIVDSFWLRSDLRS